MKFFSILLAFVCVMPQLGFAQNETRDKTQGEIGDYSVESPVDSLGTSATASSNFIKLTPITPTLPPSKPNALRQQPASLPPAVAAPLPLVAPSELPAQVLEPEFEQVEPLNAKFRHSLYDSLAKAYVNNSTILSARQGYKAAQEDIAIAKSGRKPLVSADADLTYTNTDATGSEFQVSNGSNLSRSVGVSFRQSLYSGGTVSANISQAEYLVAAQGFALSAVEQQALYDTVEAYMAVFTNRAVLDLQENNQAVVLQEFEQAQARFDVGELTRTDVSQSKARLEAARAEVINASAAVKTSESLFKQVVGIEPPTGMSYPSVGFDMPETLEGVLNLGLSNNREILQSNLNKQAAQSVVESIEGERLPQLYAQGGLTQSYKPNDFIDNQRQARVGVVASVPLYTGGATRARIRQAEKITAQRDEDIKSVKQNVERELISHWESWMAAKAETVAREAQVVAARIAQEGVDIEAEFGERTTLDALNADQELLSAQVNLTISKRNEIVSHFALARVLGLLVPKNLGFSTINP